jgi:hypothetical protein
MRAKLFNTLADLMEYLDEKLDEHYFPSSRIMFAHRDSFYGNLKYGVRKNKISVEEAENKLAREPQVKQNLIYVYACCYAEWISNQLGLTVPAWTFSERSNTFKGWGLVFAAGPTSINDLNDLAPEFLHRGIYIANYNLYIA